MRARRGIGNPGRMDAQASLQRSLKARAREGRAGSVRLALEHDARRTAERELRRHRAVLAALSAADRERVAIIAHTVASRIAACLAVEAGRDERLARALSRNL